MKKLIKLKWKVIVHVLVLCMIGLFCFSADAQSNTNVKKKKSKKVAIIVGASTVVDYQDTFKLNPTAEVKIVGNAKLQDSVTITILLDGTPNGRRIKLNPNQPFDSLFRENKLKPAVRLQQSEGWVNPGKDFSKAFVQSVERGNGYHVEIQYKNRKEKFYGVLEFNKVYTTCAGDPSARSYFIRIPEIYVLNALGGNISVVYEYYECAPRLGSKTVRDYTTKKSRYTSWVLWISDISFVEE